MLGAASESSEKLKKSRLCCSALSRVYTATLLYVIENNIVVNAKNVKTVIDKCGETTEIVESYFYTIKIDADRKARTTLNRIKQTPFK
jgi:hypothetical protein